ncbi:hypothetical protein MRX96_025723 [Rhipicephalus microplus]
MVAQSCEYKLDSVTIHVVTGHRSRQEEREALARIQDLSRAESGNLPSVVTFCTKRQFTVLKNIDVTDGLGNGMVDSLWVPLKDTFNLDLASVPTAQTTQWGSTIDLVYHRKTDDSKYRVGAMETAACYFTDHRAVFVAIEKLPGR